MPSIPTFARRLRQLLSGTAEECAQASCCVQRRRKFTGALLVQTLVFGFWLHPYATLHQLTQVAAQLGVRISPQGLDQRFSAPLVACLERVLGVLSAEVAQLAAPGTAPLLARFNGVYILDTTTISLPAALAADYPGCGGGNGGGEAAVKLAVLLELGSGVLRGLERLAGRSQDRTTTLQDAPVPAGSLRLSDLGFFTLDVFRRLGAQGGYWLSRLRAGTVVFDGQGARIPDLGRWLGDQAVAGVVETDVRLGVGERLPARLLAVRVPQGIADGRRRALRAAARKKGQAPSRAALGLADWTLLVTNVPAGRLTVDEALVLARARWQVELLFKCWKQHGQLASLRSTNPQRVLAELDAKLIALTLQQWLLAAAGFQGAEQSLVKASQTVRTHVPLLVDAVGQSLAALTRVIRGIGRCLAAGCRPEKRVAKPCLAQLLANPALTHQPALT